MFTKLYKYKNKGLFAGGLLLLLASYTFAFRKTFYSIRLNNELREKQNIGNDLSNNPEYISKKLTAVNNVLKYYRVDSAEYKNDFWLKLSGVASARGLQIIYKPAKEIFEKDSSSNILNQVIQFQGNYKQFVQSLDTVEKMHNIGRIVSLNIKMEKAFSPIEKSQTIMILNFRATDK